jgi:2-haloacid dehalogenase
MSRRRFLKIMGASALLASCGAAIRPRGAGVRAVAFDLFTLFDPRGVDRRVTEVLGSETPLAATWKARLFEYSWIRAAAGRYVDFEHLAHDALGHAARVHRVDVGEAQRARLVAAFTELEPWPDAAPTLHALAASGLRLAPLANYAPRMIEALLGRAGLREAFADLISTDRARTYKPDPRAYALAEASFGLPREQIAFAAFGGWDAAGGRWFGFPTFRVNRFGEADEVLVDPDASGPDLARFAAWIAARRGGA